MNKPIIIFFLLFSFSCRHTPINCSNIIYKNGVSYLNNEPFSGECFSYYQTGIIRSNQKYKNGLDDGEWNFFHPNAKLETQSFFKNGKRIGDWRYYFYNGNIKQESFYTNTGAKTGVWLIYNEKGDTIKKINHNNL